MVQVVPGLNTVAGTLVAGQTDVASGAEHWTIGVPPNDAVATDDPGMEGLVPTVALAIDLKANAPATITFLGSAGTQAPADSIGFTGLVQLNIKNDTGAALKGLTLNLVNTDQQLPVSLVPGVIEFGDTVNANYAYLTDIQPGSFTGLTQSLFSPNNQPTTPLGAAANSLALTGPIPVGGSVAGSLIVHNTETGGGNNNSFVMNVIPT